MYLDEIQARRNKHPTQREPGAYPTPFHGALGLFPRRKSGPTWGWPFISERLMSGAVLPLPHKCHALLRIGKTSAPSPPSCEVMGGLDRYCRSESCVSVGLCRHALWQIVAIVSEESAGFVFRIVNDGSRFRWNAARLSGVVCQKTATYISSRVLFRVWPITSYRPCPTYALSSVIPTLLPFVSPLYSILLTAPCLWLVFRLRKLR